MSPTAAKAQEHPNNLTSSSSGSRSTPTPPFGIFANDRALGDESNGSNNNNTNGITTTIIADTTENSNEAIAASLMAEYSPPESLVGLNNSPSQNRNLHFHSPHHRRNPRPTSNGSGGGSDRPLARRRPIPLIAGAIAAATSSASNGNGHHHGAGSQLEQLIEEIEPYVRRRRGVNGSSATATASSDDSSQPSNSSIAPNDRARRRMESLSEEEQNFLRTCINSRERRRMHDLNDALDDLRRVIPYDIAVGGGGGSGRSTATGGSESAAALRKMSKINTIILAANWIRQLTRQIDELREQNDRLLGRVGQSQREELEERISAVGLPAAVSTTIDPVVVVAKRKRCNGGAVGKKLAKLNHNNTSSTTPQQEAVRMVKGGDSHEVMGANGVARLGDGEMVKVSPVSTVSQLIRPSTSLHAGGKMPKLPNIPLVSASATPAAPPTAMGGLHAPLSPALALSLLTGHTNFHSALAYSAAFPHPHPSAFAALQVLGNHHTAASAMPSALSATAAALVSNIPAAIQFSPYLHSALHHGRITAGADENSQSLNTDSSHSRHHPAQSRKRSL